MITYKDAKRFINYNQESGLFTWLVDSGKARVGKEAGYLANLSSRNECKYRLIGIEGKNYLAHRLAFLLVEGKFPNCHIDHINHDGSDNRWINLRKVSSTENNRNMRRRWDNTLGICGVKKDRNKWVAVIGANSKQITLGRYDNIFDAACARKSAEKLFGYHSNHGTN